MSQQNFRDESNWKHEPHAEHHVDDKFEKGTETRNWKKNVDKNDDEKRDPPGAPDRTPIEDADKSKKKIGDPRSPTKNKPRLKQ